MIDEDQRRRTSDARIDRMEHHLDTIAQRLEQVAVLVVQEQKHDERISRLESAVTELRVGDAVQSSTISNGERLLWFIGAALLAGGQQVSGWLQDFLSPPH
jgi:hypothetical protein